jgi:hypothetical protein
MHAVDINGFLSALVRDEQARMTLRQEKTYPDGTRKLSWALPPGVVTRKYCGETPMYAKRATQ